MMFGLARKVVKEVALPAICIGNAARVAWGVAYHPTPQQTNPGIILSGRESALSSLDPGSLDKELAGVGGTICDGSI